MQTSQTTFHECSLCILFHHLPCHHAAAPGLPLQHPTKAGPDHHQLESLATPAGPAVAVSPNAWTGQRTFLSSHQVLLESRAGRPYNRSSWPPCHRNGKRLPAWPLKTCCKQKPVPSTTNKSIQHTGHSIFTAHYCLPRSLADLTLSYTYYNDRQSRIIVGESWLKGLIYTHYIIMRPYAEWVIYIYILYVHTVPVPLMDVVADPPGAPNSSMNADQVESHCFDLLQFLQGLVRN